MGRAERPVHCQVPLIDECTAVVDVLRQVEAAALAAGCWHLQLHVLVYELHLQLDCVKPLSPVHIDTSALLCDVMRHKSVLLLT